MRQESGGLKMTPKERKEWIEKLKPYWWSFKTMEDEYWRNINNLEDKMSKDLGERLEFFRVDGGVCGIGHSEINKRKKFPLFQAEKLGGY